MPHDDTRPVARHTTHLRVLAAKRQPVARGRLPARAKRVVCPTTTPGPSPGTRPICACSRPSEVSGKGSPPGRGQAGRVPHDDTRPVARHTTHLRVLAANRQPVARVASRPGPSGSCAPRRHPARRQAHDPSTRARGQSPASGKGRLPARVSGSCAPRRHPARRQAHDPSTRARGQARSVARGRLPAGLSGSCARRRHRTRPEVGLTSPNEPGSRPRHDAGACCQSPGAISRGGGPWLGRRSRGASAPLSGPQRRSP